MVAAGFGDQSDWVRNVTRDSYIVFTVGRLRSIQKFRVFLNMNFHSSDACSIVGG
jgi:hypothetical protein